MSYKVVFNGALFKACKEDINDELASPSISDSVRVHLPFVPTEEELAELVEALSEYYDNLGAIWQNASDRSLLEIYLN